MRKYCLFLVFVALAVLVMPIGCARPAATKEPIKVGIIQGLTGPHSAFGVPTQTASRLFFQTEGKEIAGRPVVIVEEDDESKADVGLTKIKKMVERDNVKVLIAWHDSGIGYACRDYVHKAGIPTFSITSGARFSRDLYSPYIYSVVPTSFMFAASLANWLYDKWGKRMIFIGLEGSTGDEVLTGAQKMFEEVRGGKIVLAKRAPYGNADWGPLVTMAKEQVDKADFVGMGMWGGDILRLMKAWNEYGMQGKLRVAVFGGGPEEGVIIPALGANGLGITNCYPYDVTVDTPENKKFVELYKKATGVFPGNWAYEGYKSCILIKAALEKIGGEVENADRLVKTLDKINVPGVMGEPMTFDERHRMIHDMRVMEIKKCPDGEYHAVTIDIIRGVKDDYKMFP